MDTDLTAFVHTAVLRLDAADLADVGAVVTSALCGTWAHDGPCSFPHNNAQDGSSEQSVLDIPGLAGTIGFRTLFIASLLDEERVRGLIDEALLAGGGWTTIATGSRAVAAEEQDLAARLLESAAD